MCHTRKLSSATVELLFAGSLHVTFSINASRIGDKVWNCVLFDNAFEQMRVRATCVNRNVIATVRFITQWNHSWITEFGRFFLKKKKKLRNRTTKNLNLNSLISFSSKVFDAFADGPFA